MLYWKTKEDCLVKGKAALCLETTADALENLIQLGIFKDFSEELL